MLAAGRANWFSISHCGSPARSTTGSPLPKPSRPCASTSAVTVRPGTNIDCSNPRVRPCSAGRLADARIEPQRGRVLRERCGGRGGARSCGAASDARHTGRACADKAGVVADPQQRRHVEAAGLLQQLAHEAREDAEPVVQGRHRHGDLPVDRPVAHAQHAARLGRHVQARQRDARVVARHRARRQQRRAEAVQQRVDVDDQQQLDRRCQRRGVGAVGRRDHQRGQPVQQLAVGAGARLQLQQQVGLEAHRPQLPAREVLGELRGRRLRRADRQRFHAAREALDQCRVATVVVVIGARRAAHGRPRTRSLRR